MPDLTVGLAPRRLAAAERPRLASRRALWAAGHVDRTIALGLAAVALALDLFRLPGTSLWADELFSVHLVTRPWPLFWEFLSRYEPNMALYYVLLRGWLGLTGLFGIVPDELVVRAPSIFFAVLSVLVVFWIGRRIAGRTVGILGALLFALNFIQLTAAREARSYSLELFLLCLGWYAFFAIVSADHPRRRVYVAYIAAMALAIYAHLFSALVVASQVMAFAALVVLPSESRERLRRSLGGFALSVAAIGGVAIPVAAYALRHGSTNPHIPPAGLLEVGRLFWNIAGHNLVYGSLLGAAVLIAVGFVAFTYRKTRSRMLLWPMVALGSWLTIPVLLSYAATQPRLNLHLFAWGYLVVVIPALCLLAAMGIVAIRRSFLRQALTIGLVAAAALATPVFSSPPDQDLRTAARWIEVHYQTGDGLIATSWSSWLGMSYYAELDGAPSDLLTGSPAPWSWTAGGATPLDQRAAIQYASARHRVFLVDSLLEGDPPETKARAWLAQAWFDKHYTLEAETAVPSGLGLVRVRLYESAAQEEED